MNAFHVGSEAAAPWNKGRLIGQKLPLKLNMRRTKATLIYRRTKNLHAVQLLLGHTKLESTVQYLGIELDDALETAEQTELEYLRSWPGLLLGTGRFRAKSLHVRFDHDRLLQTLLQTASCTATRANEPAVRPRSKRQQAARRSHEQA
jgi:hypothetical protein